MKRIWIKILKRIWGPKLPVSSFLIGLTEQGQGSQSASKVLVVIKPKIVKSV